MIVMSDYPTVRDLIDWNGWNTKRSENQMEFVPYATNRHHHDDCCDLQKLLGSATKGPLKEHQRAVKGC